MNDLVRLYHNTMRVNPYLFDAHDKFIVRLWDGMDGCWCDVTGEVPRDEALRVWAEKTDNGTKQTNYGHIDYYAIFPGGTRMLWDGSEGQEMFRSPQNPERSK